MAVRTPSPAELERRRVAADAKLQATHDTIVDGVQRLVGGQEWANYLGFAAKFHDYSFNNTVLIWAQAPQASYVAGYQPGWNWAARSVKARKESQSSPCPVPQKPNQRTGSTPGRNTAAPEPAAEPGKRRIVGVRNATIFDVSQTDPVTPAKSCH